jgi:hypothetical protein
MSVRPRPGEDNFLAMTVHNIGFLLDRLGQDCHPLQFLRELTKNSIEAIGRSGQGGEIVWDLDWTASDLDNVQKLCITDTGDGMTGDEMVRFINQLSSSVSAQSISGNYGVGAKIAAATRNPAGVLYLSWKRGEGTMIHLFRDPDTGQYGLKQWRHQDGSYAHYLALDDDVRPDIIQQGHGTKVVLFGERPDADTMRAPSAAPSPSRWISKYLNTRFFRFPTNITVTAREGWEYPRSDKDRNYLRTLTGQEPYLTQHSVASGQVELSGAIAHWWILKDESAITNNSGFMESAGHVAALYRDELYEVATARTGMSRLQQFGVTFGYRYVVIYVEATDEDTAVTTNTARTALLVNNEPLPWADWAAEFREHLPQQIADLVAEKAAAASNTDHAKAIRDRLKEIMDLFKLSRYRPSARGATMIDEERLVRGGRAAESARDRRATTDTNKGGGPGGSAGNVYAVFEKTGGAPGQRVKPDPFPNANWVTLKNGTREYGDIEDRAAKYLSDQNLLLINADFRVFADMVRFFAKEFREAPGVEEVAFEAVKGWFEQALVETVVGVQGLMNSKEWSQADIDKALSEEALTSAVMQRYHVHFAVKRELGSKLGARRSQ